MAASLAKINEISSFDQCLDPCCAKEVTDRRKAMVLKKKLDSVDRSTARLRGKDAIWGNSSYCTCNDPRCAPADYPLLAALRGCALDEDEEGADLDESDAGSGLGMSSGGFGVVVTGGVGFAGSVVLTGGGDEEGKEEEEDDDDDSDAELDAMMADGALAEVAAERFAAMEQQALLVTEAVQRGFGVHRALPHDDAAAVAYLSSCCRAIVHICDERSGASARCDLYLETAVAPRYPGTAFVRVSPKLSATSELSRFLECKGEGALVALRDGKVVARCENIAMQFGGVSSSSSSTSSSISSTFLATDALEEWLKRTGVLEVTPQPHEWGGYSTASIDKLREQQRQQEEGDEEEMFDCGQAGCRKTFAHNHFASVGSNALPEEFVAGR